MFQSVFEEAATNNKDVQNWFAEATKMVFSFQQGVVSNLTQWTGEASVRSYSEITVKEFIEVKLNNLSHFSQRSSDFLLGSVDIANSLAKSKKKACSLRLNRARKKMTLWC